MNRIENDPIVLDAQRLRPSRVVYFIVAAGIGLLIVVFGWGSDDGQKQALTEEVANLQAKLDDLETAKQVRKEHMTVQLGKTKQAYFEVQTARKVVDELQSQNNAWSRLQTEITAESIGSRIAADEALVQKYLAVQQKELPDLNLPKQLNELLDDIETPLKEAIDTESDYSPGPALHGQITKIRNRADLALDEYTTAVQQLQIIVDSTPEIAPSSLTLQESIENLKRKWAAEELNQITQAVDSVRRDGIAKKAEAQAALEKAKLAKETESIRQQAELQQTQTKMAKAKNDREIEFRKDLADIQQYLAAAITPGYFTYSRSQTNGRTLEKQPMSFSTLSSAGALQRTTRSVQTFGTILGNPNNDRPLGVLPRYHGRLFADSPEVVQEIGKAQQLLLKHKAILIEKGMLKN